MELIEKLSLGLIIAVFAFFYQSCQESQNVESTIKDYYSSGELRHEITLKDSLLHGSSMTYYKSGAIMHEKEFHEEIPIDHHYHYLENGNLLAYEFFDIRGNLRYQVHKDTFMEGYSQEGKSIYIQGKFKDEYIEGDSISLIPIIANPFKSKYRITLLYENETIDRSYNFGTSTPPLFLYWIKRGINPVKITSEILDNENKVFKRDTIALEFNAK